MRGVIIKLPDNTPGIIVANGAQYGFQVAGSWQGDSAPSINQTVEFTEGTDGMATGITIVSREVLAQEKLNALGKEIVNKGEGFFDNLKPYARIQIQAMTAPVFALAVGMEISYFFFGAFGFSSRLLFGNNNFSLTIDHLLGLELGASGIGFSITFLRVLGFLIIFLPWIMPWLSFSRKKLLNTLPLLMTLVLPLCMYMKIKSFFEDVQASTNGIVNGFGRMFGQLPNSSTPSMPSPGALAGKVMSQITFGFGYWATLLLALALLVMTFKKKSV